MSANRLFPNGGIQSYYLSHMFFQGFTPIGYAVILVLHLLICKFVACHQAICDAQLIRICNPSEMDVSLDPQTK
jgi:hypothetical protein